MFADFEEMLADSWEMPTELEEMTEKVRNLTQDAGNLGFWLRAGGYLSFWWIVRGIEHSIKEFEVFGTL